MWLQPRPQHGGRRLHPGPGVSLRPGWSVWVFQMTSPLLYLPVPETRILGETEIYVDIGSMLNLTCTVSRSPEPTEFIFWHHNETVSRHFAETTLLVYLYIVPMYRYLYRL